jgi:AcrR family transcriptional regulator
MASEVTKRIKGREYRYVVDSYLDPETNRRKQRWRYIGVVENGKVVVGSRRRITREEIVAATARLLEFRAPKHITLSVIAASAGVSRNTFYRHFPSAKEAIIEAMTRITNEALQALPPLSAPRNLEEAREQLRLWCKAYNSSVGLNRVSKQVQGYRHQVRARLEAASPTEKAPAVGLSVFFIELNDAGFTAIDDPEGLAEAVKGLLASLRISSFAVLPGERAPYSYDDLYPLIERAVFGRLETGG